METKLSMLVIKNLLATLVLYNNQVWYWNKNIFFCIFYFVNYMLHNRCIFFFFIFFLIERSILTQKQNGQLIYYSNEFAEFYWEVDANWLFVIIKRYVKVNFKERNNNNNKSHGFYRLLLQRNVDQFDIIFFKVYFFTQPVT